MVVSLPSKCLRQTSIGTAIYQILASEVDVNQRSPTLATRDCWRSLGYRGGRRDNGWGPSVLLGRAVQPVAPWMELLRRLYFPDSPTGRWSVPAAGLTGAAGNPSCWTSQSSPPEEPLFAASSINQTFNRPPLTRGSCCGEHSCLKKTSACAGHCRRGLPFFASTSVIHRDFVHSTYHSRVVKSEPRHFQNSSALSPTWFASQSQNFGRVGHFSMMVFSALILIPKSQAIELKSSIVVYLWEGSCEPQGIYPYQEPASYRVKYSSTFIARSRASQNLVMAALVKDSMEDSEGAGINFERYAMSGISLSAPLNFMASFVALMKRVMRVA